jgi:hypothetical protein
MAQEIERAHYLLKDQESQDDASKFNLCFAVLLVIGMILIAVHHHCNKFGAT